MSTNKIESFSIVGIAVRTSNSDIQQLTNDMQGLWGRFMAENIAGMIPNKLDDNIYCVYTDYEGDHTQPYTALLGCKVATLDLTPEMQAANLVGKNFIGGSYNKYLAQGNLMEGAVFKKWQEIWSMDLKRAYAADFEVYGVKAQNIADAEVEIFIGVLE